MKQYQKPALYALSLSANDALCAWGSCQAKTRYDAALNQWLLIQFGDKNGNGIFDSGDGNFFAATEACDDVFEGYCKFTAADDNMTQLFTS